VIPGLKRTGQIKKIISTQQETRSSRGRLSTQGERHGKKAVKHSRAGQGRLANLSGYQKTSLGGSGKDEKKNCCALKKKECFNPKKTWHGWQREVVSDSPTRSKITEFGDPEKKIGDIRKSTKKENHTRASMGRRRPEDPSEQQRKTSQKRDRMGRKARA